MAKFFAVLAFIFISVLPATAEARLITDAAGRKVEIPDRIDSVLVAGPPASALVYVLAPDKLAGWVSTPSDAAKSLSLSLGPQFADHRSPDWQGWTISTGRGSRQTRHYSRCRHGRCHL